MGCTLRAGFEAYYSAFCSSCCAIFDRFGGPCFCLTLFVICSQLISTPPNSSQTNSPLLTQLISSQLKPTHFPHLSSPEPESQQFDCTLQESSHLNSAHLIWTQHTSIDYRVQSIHCNLTHFESLSPQSLTHMLPGTRARSVLDLPVGETFACWVIRSFVCLLLLLLLLCPLSLSLLSLLVVLLVLLLLLLWCCWWLWCWVTYFVDPGCGLSVKFWSCVLLSCHVC